MAKAQKSIWRFRVQDKSDRLQIKKMVKNKQFIRNIYRGKRHLVCSTSAVGQTTGCVRLGADPQASSHLRR